MYTKRWFHPKTSNGSSVTRRRAVAAVGGTPWLASTQLNDVSSSAIDSLWSAAPPSNSAAELSTKAHKPVLKRFDEILGSQAFNNLGLRQPVSQSLTLGISRDSSHPRGKWRRHSLPEEEGEGFVLQNQLAKTGGQFRG